VRAFWGLLLLSGIAAVALLPLYGDVRPNDIVTHPEWARMMLRGLDLLSDDPGINDSAAQVFATLSGRESRSWPGPQYVRAERVETFEAAGAKGIRAAGGIGEASYAFGVARSGDYRLRLHLAAPAAAEAEITPAGSENVLRSSACPRPPRWAGSTPERFTRRRGYETTVLARRRLARLRRAPAAVRPPIEPRGGWKPTAIASMRTWG
jgi:hypothetical protein